MKSQWGNFYVCVCTHIYVHIYVSERNVRSAVKNMWHSIKTLYGGGLIPLNSFIRKEETSQFCNLFPISRN